MRSTEDLVTSHLWFIINFTVMMLMVLMMNTMIMEKMRSTKDLVTGHLKILWLHTNVTHKNFNHFDEDSAQLSKRHNYDIEYEDLGDDKDDDVDGLES